MHILSRLQTCSEWREQSGYWEGSKPLATFGLCIKRVCFTFRVSAFSSFGKMRKYLLDTCGDSQKDFILALWKILGDTDLGREQWLQNMCQAEGDFSPCNIPIDLFLIKRNMPHLSLFRSHLPISTISWTPQPNNLSNIAMEPKKSKQQWLAWHLFFWPNFSVFLFLGQLTKPL